MILEHTFEGKYRDKENTIKLYNKHIQNVIDLVPSDRLLQFKVQDGWDPLCEFLDVSVPKEPFPKLNKRADFLGSAPEWIKKIKRDQQL